MRSNSEIVIVGAGPTGLTLACELYRRGVACRVLERAHQRSPDSRATDIHARTLEIFRSVGIADQVLARGKKVRRFRAYSSGRLVVDLSLDVLSSSYPYAIALPQSDTEAILEERLNALGGAVERGVRVRDLAVIDSRGGRGRRDGGAGQSGRGVRLTLVHDDRGREHRESVRCDWLIGCDGVHSTVRSAVGIGFRGITYRQRYLVTDVDMDWDLACDQVHLFAAPGGFINVLALPDGDTRVRVLANLPASLSTNLATNPATNLATGDCSSQLAVMRELLVERTGMSARIERPTFTSAFRIAQRIATRYRHGPVLLVGDAAHTCSPLLGQGMNVGIQDAYNLGWKLALVAGGAAQPSLLDSYQAERRPIGRAVLTHTHLMHTVSTLRSPVVAALRDVSSAHLHDLSGFRRLAAYTCSELATHYQGSPIAPHDSHAAHAPTTSRLARARALLRAPWRRPGSLHLRGLIPAHRYTPMPGDRAPDMPLCGERDRWLFDLIGPHHALLLFHERDQPDARLTAVADEIVARYAEHVAVYHVVARESPCHPAGAPGSASASELDPAVGAAARTVCDCSALLHRGFRAGPRTACLIRPDGHIGFRGHDSDASQVLAHLSNMLG